MGNWECGLFSTFNGGPGNGDFGVFTTFIGGPDRGGQHAYRNDEDDNASKHAAPTRR